MRTNTHHLQWQHMLVCDSQWANVWLDNKRLHNVKMSLLPWLANDPFLELYRPRYFDLDAWDLSRELRQLARLPEYLNRNLSEQDSKILLDDDKFQVSVDVQQFAPSEITVKTSGDSVVVEGKHEERPDQHGYVSRHFVRRYVLPKGHDINQVASNLSSDGVLTIVAPRTSREGIEQRTIPIQQTGQPSKPLENKKQPQTVKWLHRKELAFALPDL